MAILGKFKNLGSTLLAAFLAVALLVPTADVYACAQDGITLIATASMKGDTAAVTVAKPLSETQKQLPSNGDRDCIHGHCHHVFGSVKLPEAVAAAHLAADGRIVMRPATPARDAPSVELLRPPRA